MIQKVKNSVAPVVLFGLGCGAVGAFIGFMILIACMSFYVSGTTMHDNGTPIDWEAGFRGSLILLFGGGALAYVCLKFLSWWES